MMMNTKQRLLGILIAFSINSRVGFAKESVQISHFKLPFAELADLGPPSGRVNNGDKVIQPLPFIASLQGLGRDYNWIHFCGGSLITQTMVLTAAHCLHPLLDPLYRNAKFRAAFGSTQYSSPEVAVEFQQSNMKLEPRYKNHKLYNNPQPYDFALIRLPRPVRLSDNVKTVSVAKREYYDAITIAGWGNFDCNHTSPDLLYTEGKALSKSACEEAWKSLVSDDIIFGDEKICAFATNPTDGSPANPDRGDSGGPLYYYENGQPILLGVTSFGAAKQDGSNCFQNEIPFVFSKVSANLGFIHGTHGPGGGGGGGVSDSNAAGSFDPVIWNYLVLFLFLLK